MVPLTIKKSVRKELSVLKGVPGIWRRSILHICLTRRSDVLLYDKILLMK